MNAPPSTIQNTQGEFHCSRPCDRFMPKIAASVPTGKKIAASTFKRCAATAISLARLACSSA